MTRDPYVEAVAYLASHQVMTLATHFNGNTWAAAVFYVNTKLDIMFLSAAHTRHATHMAGNPHVAATIQEDYANWGEIKGIQLEGDVVLLEGEEKNAGISLYQQKFPFLTTAPSPIQQALTKVNWYKLTPTKFYFIDNSVGFGHRDEIDVMR